MALVASSRSGAIESDRQDAFRAPTDQASLGILRSMTLEFRPARPAECEDMKALLRSAFAPYVRKLGRTDGPGPYDWLPAVIDNGDAFVATDDGHMVGVVTTNRTESERAIDHIAIDPSRQGQGTGSWLLGQIEDVARSEGCAALSLYTAEIMDDLIRFYRRHGFVETRRAPALHGRDPILRIYMTKRL